MRPQWHGRQQLSDVIFHLESLLELTQESQSIELLHLPRIQKHVGWWLKKWGRQAVIDGKEPLSPDDIHGLIKVNGGSAEALHLVERNMQGIDLAEVDLSRAILVSTDLHGASLWGTKLRNAQLADADLMEANLRLADLREAYADGTHLCNADLTEADLRGTELSGANLKGADLSGARISADTDLEDVEWDEHYINELERLGNYDEAISVYRRLKEWYRSAGMLKIAGDFHYREERTLTKMKGKVVTEDLKELTNFPRSIWTRVWGTKKAAPGNANGESPEKPKRPEDG